ncbi:recombination and DNA strand exchange inhibitor protein [Clostridium botulinum CFSAN002369]|nr:recombination and DNA strand exchange inhibitor protein [Clostridium botulinum CFSAN002369]
MKITANIKDLRAAKGSNSNNSSSKIKKSKKLNLNLRRVESSVDLRGMDAEEAIYTVDKYLDEAYLGGLGEVTIVHGKGTGVLRKTIMDMLKGHSHVKKYRLGEYGEGGTGVTVVELK